MNAFFRKLRWLIDRSHREVAIGKFSGCHPNVSR